MPVRARSIGPRGANGSRLVKSRVQIGLEAVVDGDGDGAARRQPHDARTQPLGERAQALLFQRSRQRIQRAAVELAAAAGAVHLDARLDEVHGA